MADRVGHRDGDATTDDLGSGYDAVLCFNLLHHLTSDQTVELFGRIHDALAPGGMLAVMDAFAEPSRRSGRRERARTVRLPQLRFASTSPGAVVQLAPRGRVRRASQDPHSPDSRAGHVHRQQDNPVAHTMDLSLLRSAARVHLAQSGLRFMRCLSCWFILPGWTCRVYNLKSHNRVVSSDDEQLILVDSR